VAGQTSLEKPPVNIYEGNGQLTVTVAMPGAHEDTVEVELDGRNLTVSAEARYPQEQQQYLLHEWNVGRYHRRIELPKPVEAQAGRAMLTHGVLSVQLRIGEGKGSSRAKIPVAEAYRHQPDQRSE
jgi:HSP20 family protein